LRSDASHMHTPEVQARSRARWAEAMSDPTKHEAWKEKIRKKQLAAQRRKGRGYVPKTRSVTCDICSRTVERRVSTSHMAKTMHLCGDNACLLEFRRRLAREANVMARPEVRAKLSATARARVIVRGEHGRIATFTKTGAA
jgi:hypothetical protein